MEYVLEHAAFGTQFSCYMYYIRTCMLPASVCTCVLCLQLSMIHCLPVHLSAVTIHHNQELFLWCDGVLPGATGSDSLQLAA